MLRTNFLISRNNYYIDSLRGSPGMTSYQRVASIKPSQAILKAHFETEKFLQRRPDYIANILQRIPNAYKQYQHNEKPVIQNLSDKPMWVHSAAGSYEIEILNLYRRTQSLVSKNFGKGFSVSV